MTYMYMHGNITRAKNSNILKTCDMNNFSCSHNILY